MKQYVLGDSPRRGWLLVAVGGSRDERYDIEDAGEFLTWCNDRDSIEVQPAGNRWWLTLRDADAAFELRMRWL